MPTAKTEISALLQRRIVLIDTSDSDFIGGFISCLIGLSIQVSSYWYPYFRLIRRMHRYSAVGQKMNASQANLLLPNEVFKATAELSVNAVVSLMGDSETKICRLRSHPGSTYPLVVNIGAFFSRIYPYLQRKFHKFCGCIENKTKLTLHLSWWNRAPANSTSPGINYKDEPPAEPHGASRIRSGTDPSLPRSHGLGSDRPPGKMTGVIRIGPGMKKKAKRLDLLRRQCNLEPLCEMAETFCPARSMRLGSRYLHQHWIMQMVVPWKLDFFVHLLIHHRLALHVGKHLYANGQTKLCPASISQIAHSLTFRKPVQRNVRSDPPSSQEDRGWSIILRPCIMQPPNQAISCIELPFDVSGVHSAKMMAACLVP
ncbi:uncharacterized protein CLUP02_05937 [Colletotrichum lupini]|uniref:Uncharacterized protein n=1 Tax=Colletotrichum lupini TaxID=145971 RepID=A0A9Q8WEJ4_9PEZI|nr:uncharacterized protein CLUP02_05937 [Colletotrichum lupini]UQC80454.1 hypothetical protein CLUP02_05937 [Colletotrichum lupini]